MRTDAYLLDVDLDVVGHGAGLVIVGYTRSLLFHRFAKEDERAQTQSDSGE